MMEISFFLQKKNLNFYIYDIIYELTKKELKVRYKHQLFGYIWSIANPLAFSLVYYFVFQHILGTRREDFALFLITALLPWQWISNSVGTSPFAFISNKSLIKKTNFPRNLISLVVVLQDMIHFFLAIPVILGFLFFYNKMPSFNWIIGLPLIGIGQFIIVYGLCLSIATLNLFLRDMSNIVNILLQVSFYLSPVLWDLEQLPAKFHKYLVVNPFAYCLLSWRSLFLNNIIDYKSLLVTYVIGIILFLISYIIYKKLHWRFAEVL